MFQTDAATSLEREYQGKLIYEAGRAMNPQFLSKLNDAYSLVKNKFAAEFSEFFVIDTSKSASTTPESTAAEVADKIIEVFNADIKP